MSENLLLIDFLENENCESDIQADVREYAIDTLQQDPHSATIFTSNTNTNLQSLIDKLNTNRTVSLNFHPDFMGQEYPKQSMLIATLIDRVNRTLKQYSIRAKFVPADSDAHADDEASHKYHRIVFEKLN